VVGEGEAAAEHAALHGADGDLEDLGGVGVGDPVEVAEDDGDPELLGDLGEGGLDGDGRGDHLAEFAAGGDGQASSGSRAARRARPRRRAWSVAALTAIRYSQVEKAAARRKVEALRRAARNASWVASSASSRLPRIRRQRP
jgi:hypothetical protein